MNSPRRKPGKIGGPEDLFKMLSAAGLKERIFFTLGVILLYRAGVHIPLPGVDSSAFLKHPEYAQSLLGMVDLFTGGALNKLSIFSLGIGPYITSSIILQLMTQVFPQLEDLQKNQGEQGRKKLQQITRLATVAISIMQSVMLANLLMKIQAPPVVLTPGFWFIVTSAMIMTASALFIMWLGELITERGVGNGASLLIFLGIVARLPVMVKNTYDAVQTGQSPVWGVTVLILFFLAMAALIVCLQQGVRKIMVLGARRNVGRQVFVAAPDDYLYLPINPSGVMAIIFSSSLLMFPTTVMQFVSQGKSKDPGTVIYELMASIPFLGKGIESLAKEDWAKNVWGFISAEMINMLSYYRWEHSVIYFILIMFFAYFYASIILQPKDMAENLRRQGRAIQGIRPGRPTSEFLESTLGRLVFIGASAIGIVAILPIHAEQWTQVTTLQGLGSTSLIILVGVAVDTQKQIVTHALSARYQARGLFRKSDESQSI
ncbi:MAG: preprotein translocase subunit SecY [Candidatus Melainabacteria bacterium]|nr:preprotein translocase subunit SecY [Candidatus Melainabacteria bacterium]